MEIRSLGWNKTEILPSCGRISIAVRLHHLDSNKTIREKTGWDVYKDGARCIKQILEATPYKTAAVWPSTSHLTNHPREKNSTCWTLLEKQGRTHQRRSPMDAHTWIPECGSASKNLHSSALWGHWLPPGRPTTRNGRQRRMARESQGNPCKQRAQMVMWHPGTMARKTPEVAKSCQIYS